MKKIICLLLTIILCASVMFTAFAAEDTVGLTLKTEATGQTLIVELSCADNPGVSSIQFTLAFNKAVLECTSCELSGAFSRMMSAENPKADEGAIIAAASATPISEDGLMAVYEFNIIGDGDYELALINGAFSMADGTDVGYVFNGVEGEPEVSPPPGDNPPGIPPVTPDVTPPAGNTPEIPTKPPFSDMGGHWAEGFLSKGYDRGILAGFPDGKCYPDSDVTRAQFVTFLWRSVGEPKPTKPSDFTDLNPKAEYYLDAVAWAQENGYIIGVGDNKFLPDASISRQEVATMLWRVAGEKTGGEMMFTEVYDKHFTDSSDTPAWAKGAVYWAVYNEVWCGKGSVEIGDTLASRSAASRAEIVVMMVNYQDKFER